MWSFGIGTGGSKRKEPVGSRCEKDFKKIFSFFADESPPDLCKVIVQKIVRRLAWKEFGTGEPDIRATMKEAIKPGIKHCFIQDESNNIISQIL